jgi:hypothetical protein
VEALEQRAEAVELSEVSSIGLEAFFEPDEIDYQVRLWVEPLTRDSILLFPRAGEAAPDASKIGGAFLWPEGQHFPRCEEHDMSFVPIAQLRREDVPPIPFPTGTDLFQLLWCPEPPHETAESPWNLQYRVYWRDSSSEDLEPLVPDVTRDSVSTPTHVPRPCELTFEVCPRDRGADAIDDLDPIARGTKVAGCPRWVQSPDYPVCDCGEPMPHLLTIADWGPQTSRRRKLAAYRGGSTESVVDLREPPTGLELGDVASVYFFVCPRCEHRPVRTRFQSC